VHCAKIFAEFEFGGHSPHWCAPPKCRVRLRRWENQHQLSSYGLLCCTAKFRNTKEMNYTQMHTLCSIMWKVVDHVENYVHA